MKVFLSWSGNRSRLVAELLRDWVRCVLQATRPWISTRDIDRGSVWFAEINEQLKDTAIGVVCLTGDNKDKPWILFEAGALAKGLTTSRVCTFLIDLGPADIKDPLAQFNHTIPTKSGLLGLVETINNELGVNALDYRILQQVFDTYWPQFEDGFKRVLAEHPPEVVAPPRDQRDLLEDILENTRSLNSRVARIEDNRNVSHEGALRNSTVSPQRMERIRIRAMARQFFRRGYSPEKAAERLLEKGFEPQLVQVCVEAELAAMATRQESGSGGGS